MEYLCLLKKAQLYLLRYSIWCGKKLNSELARRPLHLGVTLVSALSIPVEDLVLSRRIPSDDFSQAFKRQPIGGKKQHVYR